MVFGARSPTLSASVFGVNALVAVCRNNTDPQLIFTQLPDPPPTESWDCEALGLSVATGDSVRLFASARVPGASQDFSGTATRVAPNATVQCANTTQLVQVTVPFGNGSWSCTDGGLPISGGDIVSATITGTAE